MVKTCCEKSRTFQRTGWVAESHSVHAMHYFPLLFWLFEFHYFVRSIILCLPLFIHSYFLSCFLCSDSSSSTDLPKHSHSFAPSISIASKFLFFFFSLLLFFFSSFSFFTVALAPHQLFQTLFPMLSSVYWISVSPIWATK